MSVYCYILRSSSNWHYTGITKDFKRRLLEHNSGSSRSTKYHLPLSVVFLHRFSSYVSARRLEVYIKSIGARRFLATKAAMIANQNISHG